MEYFALFMFPNVLNPKGFPWANNIAVHAEFKGKYIIV